MLLADQPTTVRKDEILKQNQIESYLQKEVFDFEPIVAIKQFAGGYSNLTYNIICDNREYVLRRPPLAASIKGGHDMAREFKVLCLLSEAGYSKIPQPIHFCADETVIGVPFYIMERKKGVVLRAGHPQLLQIEASTFRKFSEQLVDALVEIHSIPIYDTPLMALGKPEGYIQRQIEGWQRRYIAAMTDDISAMSIIYQWLNSHIPTDTAASLIHNDFKYDNVMFDERDNINAILDWEMCTLGHPLMDVGIALSYWSESKDDALLKSFNLTHLEGNLTRQDFARLYSQKSGRNIDNLLFFYVYGLFKNAGILQQIYARWKNGHTQDPRFGTLIHGVKALATKAIRAIEEQNF
jgi:aminoglycoside phosphotransferase (APT) family kinase protein